MNQSEYAKKKGLTPQYISKLKNQGVIVFKENGEIDEQASDQRINENKDPAKQQLSEYHAQQRQKKAAGETISAGQSYQQARAMKEQYAAMQARIAYEKEIGNLLDIQSVRLAIMDSDAIVRNKLESLPDIIAPLLADESDESKIRAILLDQIEMLLTDLSKTFRSKYAE